MVLSMLKNLRVNPVLDVLTTATEMPPYSGAVEFVERPTTTWGTDENSTSKSTFTAFVPFALHGVALT